jgi:hypothetical protein
MAMPNIDAPITICAATFSQNAHRRKLSLGVSGLNQNNDGAGVR